MYIYRLQKIFRRDELNLVEPIRAITTHRRQDKARMAKKKTLKQQDFQKKKLKVGKPKQAASNATDTSFVAKTIHLPNQTKLTSTNDAEADLLRRLSLCKHHSEITRKETLIYLQVAVPRVIHGQVASRLMSACIPLMCDPNKHVREELLKLLDVVGSCDANTMRLYMRPLVLFMGSAMTHISAGVQRDSGRFLQCVLRHAGHELVRAAWVKMLRGLCNVLGWPLRGAASASAGAGSNVVSMHKNRALQHQNLQALADFIRLGCAEPAAAALAGCAAPALYAKYLLPDCPQPYSHLKLFVREFPADTAAAARPLHELDTLVCEDAATRRDVFLGHFRPVLAAQLPSLVKDGGDCGRVAANLLQLLDHVQQAAA